MSLEKFFKGEIMAKVENQKTEKVTVVEFFKDVKENVDPKKVKAISIFANSRSKCDGVWENRAYVEQVAVPKVTNFEITDNGIVVNGVEMVFAKIFKTSNDCIVFKDGKGKVLYSKILKDGKIVDYDVDAHNEVVFANKLAKKSTTSLLSGLTDEDLDKVKEFISQLN